MIRSNTQLAIIPLGTILNANLVSAPIQLQFSDLYAIQIVFGSTVNGTFLLQASCDPVGSANLQPGTNGLITYNPQNFTEVANSSFSVSTAGSVFWNSEFVGYNFVQVVFTDASGGSSTGTILSATANIKGN